MQKISAVDLTCSPSWVGAIAPWIYWQGHNCPILIASHICTQAWSLWEGIRWGMHGLITGLITGFSVVAEAPIGLMLLGWGGDLAVPMAVD